MGYENWVSKSIEYYGDPKDLVILISSSGKSKNIINAAKKAKSLNMSVITLTGFNMRNPISKLGDLNFWVDSNEYNIIEMVHHVWLVSLVDHICEIGRNET